MKSFKIYLLLISIFTISVHAQTTYTWFGGEGDWEVASNWSPNGVPGFMDTAVIDTGVVTLTKSDSIANLKLAGILQGTTSLTVLSEMTWTAGQMNGTGSIVIAEAAELYLRASPDQIISSTRKIYNYGMAKWDSGNVYIVSSGTFYNFGTFHDNIEEQYLIRGTTAESKFINQGRYVKSGTAVSFLWVIVINNGIFEIQNGTADFHGFTFTNNDSLVAAEDTKVYFNSGWTYIYGPLVCSGEVKFNGNNAIIDNVLNISGNIVFSNGKTTFTSNSSFENFGNIAPVISRDGTVLFNTGGEVKLDSLNLAGGNLGGSDNILINKSLVWTGGVSSSSNLGVYQGGTVLTIGQDASFILESRSNNHIFCQIDNYGTTIAKNGILDFYDGVDFNNYGTFIDSVGFYNRGLEEGSIFKNAGSFIKSADRECHMALKFENDAGALLKAYGTMNMIGGFSNEGDVSPGDSIGILSFVGDYPTASSSLLQIELSGKLPGTEYDQVKISNDASLGGTLDIILLNDFLPNVGDEFQIMTFASSSGSFDTINGLDTGKGVAFEVVQSATDVKLVAVEATPNTPPSTFNLISPEDKTVLEVMETIEFSWHASSDVEGDSLFYDLNISEASFDTTITHIADTSFKFISQNSLEYNTSYDWTVTVTDGISEVASPDVFSFTTPLPNDISQQNDQIPDKFRLAQNYPNPFNPVTVISWRLAVGSEVELVVYNLLGESVATLVNGYRTPGNYQIEWNAAGLPSGIYIYSIQTDYWQDTKKMVLLK